jgi:protein PhnA
MSNLAHFLEPLKQRSNHQCELCRGDETLDVVAVPRQGEGLAPAQCVLLCARCVEWMQASELKPQDWNCLREAAWSEVPAVQVVAWRLLKRMPATDWARELLEQLYLDETVLAWAAQDVPGDAPVDATPVTVDCNGTPLQDGDSVTLIKSLDIKGASSTAKRGTLAKNIRLTDNPEHIDARVNDIAVVLKTCFVKKV